MKIIYRGTRQVVSPVRLSAMWAYRPNQAPRTQEEIERARAVVAAADRRCVVPSMPTVVIYDDSIQETRYGWHVASLLMMAVIILTGFYAAAH